MCEPSISGIADGYHRLQSGGICTEVTAGRMFEARCSIFPWGFLETHLLGYQEPSLGQQCLGPGSS